MKHRKIYFRYLLFIALLTCFVGCATYYKRNLKFQEYLLSGEVEKAESYLNRNSKDSTGRNRLLFYFNKGYVNWMMQQYQESNTYFSSADDYIESYVKNYGKEALAILTNPSIKPYTPEDFEAVFVNFFKAYNYIQLNEYEDALVECRRINIRLNKLDDKFKDTRNTYQADAFAHNMMGMIYEANRDYNNAFIAYRNAYEIYNDDYSRYFGVSPPYQLKKDLLRAAYNTGFYDEVRHYEKLFNIEHIPGKNTDAELIFFWFNGFGPVKSEWSINFTVVKGDGGHVTLVNDELGLSFPYYVGDKSDQERKGFSDLRFLRVAFPKYVERKPVYTKARLKGEGINKPLELAEDVNQIAFKSLHDRMLRELGTALLRLATKKALEAAASKEDENLGAIVSIANAISERADTRNWQTLPYSISYTRIPLKSGINNITLQTISYRGIKDEINFTFEANEEKLYFHSFHSIESQPLQGY